MSLDSGFRYTKSGSLEDKEGHPADFQLLVNEGDGPSLTNLLATVMENMKTIGIYMELLYVDFGTLVEKLAELMSTRREQ